MRVFNGLWVVAFAASAWAGTESTTVTPHMEVPVTAGQNIVYCSTFQIVWNNLKDDIVGSDIRLEEQLDLVDHLNNSPSTAADMPAGDYLAMVDYGSGEFVDRLNRALREKFGPNAPQLERRYSCDDVIVAYAYLEKSLRFARPFDAFTEPMSFWSDDTRRFVDGFGIGGYSQARHGELRDQVEILDYQGARDFVIRLRSTNPDDEIVLAHIRPEETLRATYELVEERVESAVPAYMEERDVLMIPKLAISADHSYDSLLGLFLRNKGFEEYFVDEARQVINFGFDELGASVDSESRLVLKKGPGPEYKRLVFSGSFLVYMKTKGAKYPYFAVWVDNEDLMIARD
jgi:hypothetical protein